MDVHVTNAGDQAPDFKIVGDDGRTYTRSDFGGKLLVLNFWASWCAPCVQEAPSLDAFQRTMATEGVVVLGVSIDTSDKRYEQFLRRFRITFPRRATPSANVCVQLRHLPDSGNLHHRFHRQGARKNHQQSELDGPGVYRLG